MFSSRRVFILPYTASHLWFWLISHSHRPSAVVMNSETWASVAFSLRHGIYVNSQSCRTGLHAIHSCTWWVRAWKKKNCLSTGGGSLGVWVWSASWFTGLGQRISDFFRVPRVWLCLLLHAYRHIRGSNPLSDNEHQSLSSVHYTAQPWYF